MQGIATQFATAMGVEQAQFDALGVRREHREVHAAVDDLCAQGMGATGKQLFGQARAHVGNRIRQASGGSSSTMDWPRPWAPCGSTHSAREALPMPLPP